MDESTLATCRWEQCFEGRQHQLEWLKQQWQVVKQGQPKMITILGETGLGKTRLAQELFAYLSKDEVEDPNGYWPSQLEIGRNLECNPKPEIVNTEVNIPWLWWGVRFAIPSDRNQITSASPFVNQDPNLAIHAIPILRMRKRKAAQWEAGRTLSTILADAVSVGLYGSALGVVDMFKQHKAYEDNAAMPIDVLLAKQLEEVVEQTVKTLSLFLNPSETDGPTVPVVMLIDDAQWMDPVTLQAINSLMSLALEENWPLFILCTHWQKEWNEYPNLDIYHHQTVPQNLKQLGDVLNHRSACSALTLSLDKLNESQLAPVVESALPGIGVINQQYLLKEADGNPRALEEMIRLLLNKSALYFENGDVNAVLSSKGEKRLTKIQATDIYKLVSARFEELEPELQDLLGTGALIGPEFLKPLVVDLLVASEEHNYQHFDNVDVLAAKAQDIHALIQAKSSKIGQFQQKIYQSVAYNYLKTEEEECYGELLNIQHTVYKKWLKADKYKQLDANEQHQLFELILNFVCADAHHYFSPHDLAKAFDKIISFYNNNHRFSPIALWWKRLLQQPQHWLIDFAKELEFGQFGLLTLLQFDSGQLELLLPFIEELKPKLICEDKVKYANWHWVLGDIYLKYTADVEAAQVHYQKQMVMVKANIQDIEYESAKTLRALSISLNNVAGLALRVHSDINTAEAYYKESLQIGRDIVERFGADPERLQDISISLDKVADLVLRVHSDVSTAEAHYTESLQIRRDIVKRFGADPQRLQDISISLKKLSDLALRVHSDVSTAEAYFKESLQIGRDIVERFGSDPERLRDISISLDKVADLVLRVHSDVSTAEAHYTESLQIRRDIVERFGADPERLQDISISLDNVAEIALRAHSDISTAEAHYTESLQVRRDIFKRFGADPERLRAISISLDKVADLTLRAHSDVSTAEAHYKESLQIRRDIVERFGADPERLRDISASLNKVANLALRAHNNVSTAEAHYTESLQVGRDIVERFGADPERLRDISISLDNVADLALRVHNNVSTAEAHYTESLQISRDIVERFGADPERLRDISVSLDNVADLALRVHSDVSTAEAYYTESLQIRRDIVERFGADPERLQDISISLDNFAYAALSAHNDVSTAEAYYTESLQSRRDIVERFGADSERLRAISVSLDNVADLALHTHSDVSTAEAHYTESLQIRRNIVERFGADPERLRDIFVSYLKMAEVCEHQRILDICMNWMLKAKTQIELIIHKYGALFLYQQDLDLVNDNLKRINNAGDS